MDETRLDIDTQGLQVYIELKAFAQECVEELKRLGLNIEVTEPVLRLIQARIPRNRLEAVSQLPFVAFTRLPDCGYPNQ